MLVQQRVRALVQQLHHQPFGGLEVGLGAMMWRRWSV